MSRKGNEITRAIFEKVEKDGLPIDTTDWQQVRITIAAHIAGGLAQRGVFSATKTVEWTDALIEELQKGGQDE